MASPCSGSRGVTGTWPESWLSQCDTDGVSVAQALVNAGLDPARIAHAARHPRDIAAYLELHIEQGPCLEQAGLRSAWWRRLTAPDG